jgi:ornithine cyclodeaminase
MATLLLGDDDVRARLDAPTAVTAVRQALLAHHAGTLTAPPRVRAGLGDGDLVFTAGQLREQGLHGFRVYDDWNRNSDQLVAVWDTGTGRLRGLVYGGELGPRRTGAIGALAVNALARPEASRLGLVGAGVQAWTQLWALAAVRHIDEVVVSASRPARAAAFAERAWRELDLKVRAVDSAERAVRGQDIVIVATNSATPVLNEEWVSPGTHLTTLGPKTVSQHEIPAALAERADVVVTDSRAQAAGYAESPIFGASTMTELGAVLAGAAPGRTSAGQITVFCSVGLAGTDVAVAAALLG